MLRARNEKGGLWREAGAHQWLPQGAGLGGGREESEEQRMLELAIRISLEEEASRNARDNQAPPLPPRRGVTGAESYSTAMSHPESTLSPLSPTSNSPTLKRLIPPTRVPPPIPTSEEDELNLNRTLPPTPASSIAPSVTSSIGRKPPLAFVAPSPPKIFSYQSSADGSPEEMPFLRANESFITAREDATTTASVSGDGDEALSRNGTVGTFGESLVESDLATRGRWRGEHSVWSESTSTGGGGNFSDEESRSRSGSASVNGISGHHSNRTPFDAGHAEDVAQLSDTGRRFTLASENFPHNVDAEALEVRNPDSDLEEDTSNASSDHLINPTGVTQTSIPGSYPPFRWATARSMSLISERTEPTQSTVSLALPSHSIEYDSPIEEEEHLLGATPDADDQHVVDEAPLNEGVTTAPSFRRGEERLNIGPSEKLKARLEEEKVAREAVLSGAERAGAPALPSSQSLTSPIEVVSPATTTFPPEEATFVDNATPPPVETNLEPVEINDASEGQTRLVEPRIVFGEGVRFGWPAPCAEEPDHSCTTDGLHSEAPFPSEIMLTTKGEGEMDAVDKFSVEASTWTSLLRFLMW